LQKETRLTDVLAFLTFGESLLVAIALAVYAAVIWMIVDILRRPDFSGLEKVLWVIAGLVFSIATLIVYFLWVKKRDYSSA
jgi:Phospholipase_D-nuclease N-terminal